MRRRRLPADERRREMLHKAAEYFARHGFDTSTRDLAAALGVTQGLIYKHFESKGHLIERTLEAVFDQASGDRPWFDAEAPLEDALRGFYRSFVANATETRMRLFIRAGLDGHAWPTRRGAALTERLFVPVIGALRSLARLPSLDDVPAMRGERELVMMLHASMVFLGIRRHVYGMPMPDNLDDVVDLYVATFVAGAVPSVRALHKSGEESLRVTLLAQTPNKKPASSSSPRRRRTSSK